MQNDSLGYAIYHSPLPVIRELLELGADPTQVDHDGFPPLIAAIASGRRQPEAPGRTDVIEIIDLLLAHGADPAQRGINDYTALHMAVAEANVPAVRRLLAHGADPAAPTRIDGGQTPIEMAEAAGLLVIAGLMRAPAR